MDKKKILVVEDEKAIADILVFNLQQRRLRYTGGV